MAGPRFYAFTAEKLVVGDVADLADKAEDEALRVLNADIKRNFKAKFFSYFLHNS